MALLLTACATEDVKPRPGVLEAKSCMKHINQSPKNYDNFVIKNCTNNGVWQVEERDPKTGMPMITYDFVNREYLNLQAAMQFIQPAAGAEDEFPYNENAISMDMMSEPERQQFLTLQKKLNKALLD